MIALLLALALPAQAQDTPTKDRTKLAKEAQNLRSGAGTGFVIGQGHGRFGLFRPVAIGVSDTTELGTTGLMSLVAPRVTAKQELVNTGSFALSGIGSLGIPTGGIALLRTSGILTTDPTVKTPISVTGSLGLASGIRARDLDVGLSVEGRFGAAGAAWNLETPGMWFVDPMLAPLTEGPQVKPRLVVDYNPRMTGRHSLGVTADTWVQLGAGGPDAALRTTLTWGFSRRFALAVGDVMAWENRQGRPFYATPFGDFQVRW